MENMSNGEMWAVFFIGLYWFTGLWRIAKQLPVIIRSGLRPERHEYLNSLLFLVQFARISGLLTAILIGMCIYRGIPLSKFFWVWTIFGTLFTLNMANHGRKIIGDRIPSWIARRRTYYEGFDESLNRLPETCDKNARRLFENGQQFEISHDYEKAIDIYGNILATDPVYVRCLTAKGILHCIKNEFQEGRTLFLRATEACPDSAFAFHLLARAEKQIGIDLWQIHEMTAQHNLDIERAKEMLEQQKQNK